MHLVILVLKLKLFQL